VTGIKLPRQGLREPALGQLRAGPAAAECKWNLSSQGRRVGDPRISKQPFDERTLVGIQVSGHVQSPR